MANLLTLAAVSKQYLGNIEPSLQHFSIKVNKGTTLALMGESGSGKTTLLRLIAGLEDATTGEILFQGKKLLGPKDKLVAGMPNIRLINQNLTIPPNQSIAASIAYQLRHHTHDYKIARTDELLSLFQLAEYAEKQPNELSGGQRQRALFAWAIADEPDLLLMDEPLSHLDDMFKDYLYEQVFKILKKSKTTVIFATHQVNEVFKLADEVVLMQQGKALQQGQPEHIYNFPTTVAAAKLMGTCNVLPARKFFKLFNQEQPNIPVLPNQKVIIRPHHLNWNELNEGQEALAVGEVQQILFMGGYYEIKIKISKTANVLYRPMIIIHSLQKPNAVGSKVALSWVQNKWVVVD